MHKRLILLCSALLCTASFATDPNAGMVAAREMGLHSYVQFQRHGKADSAALFFWRGNWWVYHPTMGSFKTVMDDPSEPPLVAALTIEGATGPLTWKSVSSTPLHADMANACLPQAVADVRKSGGGIKVTPNHAEAVR